MIRAVLVILALAHAGGTARAEPASFALVWDDGWVHTRPEATSLRVRSARPFERSASPGRVHAVRVLRDVGDWVEVAVPQEGAGAHCYPVWLVYPDLRLFVRKTDLAPVTTRPATVAHDDGTEVSLTAGVAVVGGAAHTQGRWLLAPLAADALGSRYAVGKSFAAGGGSREYVGPPPRVGGRAIAAGKERAWRIHGERRRGSRALVTLRTTCTEVKALVPRRSVRAARAPSDPVRGALLGVGQSQPQWKAPAGTVMLWADGKRAGALTSDAVWTSPQAGRELVCASVQLVYLGPKRRDSDHAAIEVCVRAKDLLASPSKTPD